MKQNHKLALIQSGYNTVAVTFNCDLAVTAEELTHNKLYTYKNLLILKPNDLIVVPANDGFKVVRVIEVHDEPQIDLDSNIEYKWTIAKLDLLEYNTIIKNEQEALKTLSKAERNAVREKAKEELKALCGNEIPVLNYKPGGAL